MKTMNRRLVVLLSIIALDAIGIGLIFPILPSLLRAVTGSAEISVLYGVILALYAFMQFVFSPVLGALSDRFGRRPVLLVSIAGATVDYLFMAASPVVWALLVGRAIAGLTSANLAVATAYVTDITDESARAKRMGFMNAAFGIGFIVGPIVGGVVGTYWLRGPFVIAALLNAVNFALTWFLLPESREPSRTPLNASALNPLGPMRRIAKVTALAPLIGTYLIIGLVGNIPGTVWVLYGQDRYHWSGMTVGLSLAMFGVCHAGAQAVLTGPITKRFGEIATMVIGIVCDTTAMVIIGLASAGWVAFALAPLFAMGGIGMPALQSIMTRQVDETRQGELQGVLASIMSITSIIGPLVGSFAYALTKSSFIGAVWIVGAGLYLFTFPLLRAAMSSARTPLVPLH